MPEKVSPIEGILINPDQAVAELWRSLDQQERLKASLTNPQAGGFGAEKSGLGAGVGEDQAEELAQRYGEVFEKSGHKRFTTLARVHLGPGASEAEVAELVL